MGFEATYANEPIPGIAANTITSGEWMLHANFHSSCPIRRVSNRMEAVPKAPATRIGRTMLPIGNRPSG